MIICYQTTKLAPLKLDLKMSRGNHDFDLALVYTLPKCFNYEEQQAWRQQKTEQRTFKWLFWLQNAKQAKCGTSETLWQSNPGRQCLPVTTLFSLRNRDFDWAVHTYCRCRQPSQFSLNGNNLVLLIFTEKVRSVPFQCSLVTDVSMRVAHFLGKYFLLQTAQGRCCDHLSSYKRPANSFKTTVWGPAVAGSLGHRPKNTTLYT